MSSGEEATNLDVVVVTEAGDENLRKSRIKRLFFGLAALSIIINLDGGAVPGSLIHIQDTFNLNIAQVGLLGMLVYQGVAIGCVLVGPLLNKVSPTRATQATLILNTAATACFGGASSIEMLLIARISIGILQAIPAVYFPVWVDEFAPEEGATLWMALIQAGAPLGITIGYVFGASLTASAPGDRCPMEDPFCAWRIPFYIQSGALVVFSLVALTVPKSIYDLQKHASPSEDSEVAGFDGDSWAASLSEDPLAHSEDHMGPASRLSAYLTEALLPMPMRATLGETARASRASQRSAASSASSASSSKGGPGSELRRERTDKWIRRLSAPIVDTTPDSLRGSQAPEETVPTAVAPADAPAPSRRSQRVSSAVLYRPSMTTQELAADGSRRAHVVSAIELFFPLEGTQRASERPSSRQQPQDEATQAHQGATIAAGEATRPRAPLIRLLTNGVYMCSVLGLSALFFVVTGVQFWVTSYIVKVIAMEQTYVMAAFGVTVITAPILGVFAGGAFIDKIGGYKGASAMITTLKCCCVFAFIAAGTAITAAAVPKALAQGTDGTNGSPAAGFAACIGLIALTLIFGGAIIPAATGVIVSSVPIELRNLGSAFSMFLFQQMGYALAPIVSAAVASTVTLDDAEVARLTTQFQDGGFNTTLSLIPVGLGAAKNVTKTLEELTLEEVLEGRKAVGENELCFWVVMLWGLLGGTLLLTATVFAAYRKVDEDENEEGDRQQRKEVGNTQSLDVVSASAS